VTRWVSRAVCALALVGLGAALQSMRAQGPATFNGTFRHVGLVVRDVDASAKSLAQVFNASYSPVHSVVPPGPSPKGYPGDPKAGVRTTEMKTNGLEIHLLQPTGGRSPWRDGLERHGDGSLQHISFGVTDLAASVTALEKLGGHLTAGAGDGFFAYVEFAQLPFTIELEKVAR
jgi:hypothetical protein